ncbi:MAG: KpsF/GutQ family sugar-phosphate isomerase [Bacteroidetes bacterium]|nr:MAG: D-arabinose 5-phosphate isomerase [Cryomorphaceae bacterium BACL29 MAG-121220-bin8]MDA0757862.1 KpsF/GutQ family sugar-phosphate isomerase [Bacteroidota bacterium]MDA1019757.1 KpsF/GutQ family sugar-phosphate isomerase [Bacteroidota bacterium]
MNSNFNILQTAQESIKNQGEAILNLSNFINSDFENSVKAIQAINGRVIVTGIGKSAIIAKKIVATFNSTGTPSVFMHAAEAIHGDLGIVQNNDIIILISKSGNTSEIKTLIPFLKETNVKLIGISSEENSYLGLNSDFFLKSFIEKEACHNNLAPTTSTTAQLVIGDALAICLSKLNGFKKSDFARYHPGGSLGRELHLKVKDIIKKNKKPEVKEKDNLATIINEISNKMLGATAITNNQKAIGIITDGDLRRFFSSGKDINSVSAKDFMSKTPKTINSESLASEALIIMNKNKITQLIVQDKDSYIGIIHLHNILNEGLS